MMQPGRKYEAGNGYRYGFNGKEYEVQTGNYDFGARFYNFHLSRFFSSDPKEEDYPWQSTYAFAANNPISLIDVNGENPGDPPTTAFHNTSIENGAKIIVDGKFKAGQSGWNYFMTDPSGTKAGSEVARAPVQFKVDINMKGAQEISYKQWNEFFNNAKSKLGLSDIANQDLSNTQIQALNAIRNEAAINYMNSIKKAEAFIIHADKRVNGQKFYVLRNNAIAKRISPILKTTRGGVQMISRVLWYGGKKSIMSLSKSLVRGFGEGLIFEGVSFALDQKHSANRAFAKSGSSNAYADVGYLYYTGFFDLFDNSKNNSPKMDYKWYNEKYKTNYTEKEYNSLVSYGSSGY